MTDDMLSSPNYLKKKHVVWKSLESSYCDDRKNRSQILLKINLFSTYFLPETGTLLK